jgi:hypothetical protein
VRWVISRRLLLVARLLRLSGVCLRRWVGLRGRISVGRHPWARLPRLRVRSHARGWLQHPPVTAGLGVFAGGLALGLWLWAALGECRRGVGWARALAGLAVCSLGVGFRQRLAGLSVPRPGSGLGAAILRPRLAVASLGSGAVGWLDGLSVRCGGLRVCRGRLSVRSGGLSVSSGGLSVRCGGLRIRCGGVRGGRLRGPRPLGRVLTLRWLATVGAWRENINVKPSVNRATLRPIVEFLSRPSPQGQS